MADQPLDDDQLEEAGRALKAFRQILKDRDRQLKFKNNPKRTLEDAGVTWSNLPDSVQQVVEALHHKELAFLAQQVDILEHQGLIEDREDGTSSQVDASHTSFATICKF